MDIEQLPPQKPNFLKIVYLFCAAIILLFVIALAFLHYDRRHITFRTATTNHAQLRLAPTSTSQAA